MYRAHCLTLPSYRSGRIFFAGDAAHLVPIFGVRGLNSGIDDAANLCWKLARAVEGRATERLLDSYSDERVYAARENIRQARKSTLFMTPPTRGHEVMREAALSLAVSNPFARVLVNPRQTTAITFPSSELQTPDAEEWRCGPPPGATLPNLRVGDRYLLDVCGPRPVALIRAGDRRAEEWLASNEDLQTVILSAEEPCATALGLDVPGAGYLARPDAHVAARWRSFVPEQFSAALTRLFGE